MDSSFDKGFNCALGAITAVCVVLLISGLIRALADWARSLDPGVVLYVIQRVAFMLTPLAVAALVLMWGLRRLGRYY